VIVVQCYYKENISHFLMQVRTCDMVHNATTNLLKFYNGTTIFSSNRSNFKIVFCWLTRTFLFYTLVVIFVYKVHILSSYTLIVTDTTCGWLIIILPRYGIDNIETLYSSIIFQLIQVKCFISCFQNGDSDHAAVVASCRHRQVAMASWPQLWRWRHTSPLSLFSRFVLLNMWFGLNIPSEPEWVSGI
jgi:hypothetical protein